MDALEINYRLKRLGYSQVELAEQLGVSPSVVSGVINDRTTSFDVALHIAKLLGEEVTALWPNRYCFKPRPTFAQRKAMRDQQES